FREIAEFVFSSNALLIVLWSPNRFACLSAHLEQQPLHSQMIRELALWWGDEFFVTNWRGLKVFCLGKLPNPIALLQPGKNRIEIVILRVKSFDPIIRDSR